MIKKKVFVRVDDVYEINEDLKTLLNLAKENKIPLSVGVIPMKINSEAAKYLLDKERKEEICIHQHGVYHLRKGKGEFGNQNEKQLIKKGKEKMIKLFGRKPMAISLPWQYHGKDTLKILDNEGYKIVSSHFDQRLFAQFFYFCGRFLGRQMFLEHHVSYHPNKIVGTNMIELSTSIDLVKSYKEKIYKETEGIIKEIKNVKQDYFGILVHPLKIKENFDKFESVFNFLSKNYEIIKIY